MHRYVSVVYCDDIRTEVGNKHSYIGIYQDDLLVPQMPIVLSKLCVVLTIVTPRSHPFERLVCRIFLDDRLLGELMIPEADLKSMPTFPPPPPQIGNEPHDPLIVFRTAIAFSPFRIEQESRLRVRVDTGDEELRGLSLKLAKAPPAQVPHQTQVTPIPPTA